MACIRYPASAWTSYGQNDSSRLVLGAFTSVRWYTPLSEQEQEAEKNRVARLSDVQKDLELRKYNRELARLELLKAINTGEAYSYYGRYKLLAKNYGIPLAIWYWVVWSGTFGLTYGAMTVFDVDAMYALSQIDLQTGYDLVSKVDPSYGKFGMVLILNELLEPIRLPFVVMTVKPVVDTIYPSKY